MAVNCIGSKMSTAMSILVHAVLLLLAPAAGVSAFFLKRNWHRALLICAAALVCWCTLLYSEFLVSAAAVAAFNRIPHPTEAEILQFTSDGATSSFFFLLGFPFFLLYGMGCFALACAGHWLFSRLIRT